MLRILFLCLGLVSTFAAGAYAGTQQITEKMIEQKNNQLEKILNNRGDYTDMIKFLHDHISENAKFKMTVTNPLVRAKGASPVMNMNKQDYINTYLQGTQLVEDYSVDITTAAFRYDPEKHKAYSVDITTERGEVPNLMKKGRPFVSQTTCRTQHEMQDGALVATESECHTNITFEEDI